MRRAQEASRHLDRRGCGGAGRTRGVRVSGGTGGTGGTGDAGGTGSTGAGGTGGARGRASLVVQRSEAELAGESLGGAFDRAFALAVVEEGLRVVLERALEVTAAGDKAEGKKVSESAKEQVE